MTHHSTVRMARDQALKLPLPCCFANLLLTACRTCFSFFCKIVNMPVFAEDSFAASTGPVAAPVAQPIAASTTPTAATTIQPTAAATLIAPQQFAACRLTGSAYQAALEPPLVHLLRTALISEELISIIQVQGINDRETFVSLADSVLEFRKAAKDLFCIEILKGSIHRLMHAKAWSAAKHHSEA